jgi:hypothetical protein
MNLLKGMLPALMAAMLLVSCSNSYNNLFKTQDYDYKYEAAKQCYAAGKYVQCYQLLDELVRLLKGSKIRSGYSANAEIELASAKGVLTVPESAIEFSGDSTFVYVVQGQPGAQEKTYERKRVVTGLSDGVNIEIKSGINKNQKVRGPQIVADTKEQ